jgi:hypothetical protein
MVFLVVIDMEERLDGEMEALHVIVHISWSSQVSGEVVDR